MENFKQIFWPIFLFLAACVFYFFNDFCLKIIEFFNDYYVGIFVIIFLFYCLYILISNWITEYFYKREYSNNNERYLAQRCYEDGFGYDKKQEPIKTSRKEIKQKDEKKENLYRTDVNNEDNRDYFYLVDKRKRKYYRIVDTYTLHQLGYPRPSRRPEKCFRILADDGNNFSIGREIKIYNIISDIKEIIKLKDK